MTTRAFARAKINLCLHVTGLRDDRLHLLDSLVSFADVGDRLTFEPAQDLTLTIDGPFAKSLTTEPDNLILRAGKCFAAETGCRVQLQKNLPVAAGIGGGSADAAAALQGFSSHWQLPIPDLSVQLNLGADVPVCVNGTSVRMRGIGQNLTPANFLPDLPAVLVNPGVAVSTPLVFAELTEKQNPEIGEIPEQPLPLETAIDWLAAQRNDLQAPAISLAPVIRDVMQELEQAGGELVRMSGSGATCFGLFKNREAADQAVIGLKRQKPDWWVVSTVLSGSGHTGHNEI